MRQKQIFAIVLVLLLVRSLALVACNNDEVVTKKLQSISIDTTNAKTTYFVGEAYSSAGLVVRAEFRLSNSAEPEVVTLTADEIQIDSSAFNTNKAGEYQIRVSYTYESDNKAMFYRVTVVEVSFDGINVEFAAGYEDTYYLDAEHKTVEIDTSKIVVKEVDINGNVMDSAITDYSVELYRGTQKVELTNGKASVGEGAYQIWASKPSQMVANYVRKAFVTVYVNDNLVSLSWDENAEGTVTSQEKGEDIITPTLKFIATYSSGAVKTVTSANVTFTEKVVSVVGGQEKVAKLIYTEANAKGESHTSNEVSVLYNINKRAEGLPPLTIEFDAGNMEIGSLAAETELAPGIYAMATAEKQLVVEANEKSADGYTFTQRIKLGGQGTVEARSIKIVVDGPATVVVYVITASGSDTNRTISLFDTEGNVVPGTTTEGIPNAVTKFELKAPDAGTYFLWATNGVNIYYISVTC